MIKGQCFNAFINLQYTKFKVYKAESIYSLKFKIYIVFKFIETIINEKPVKVKACGALFKAQQAYFIEIIIL